MISKFIILLLKIRGEVSTYQFYDTPLHCTPQDIQLDEESEGDENVDPEQEKTPEGSVEKEKNIDKNGETDIIKEYDMDNYDDGKN